MEMNMKAWCFGIGIVDATKFSEPLMKARGFIGVADYPRDKYTCACIFETENDAKIARNLLEFDGAAVSRNVIECHVNEEEIKAIKEKNKR